MRYIVVIDTTPSRTDPTGVRRLRMMLKTLWRGWQMRCVEVKPSRATEAGEGNHTTDAQNAAEAKPEPLEGNTP